VKKDCSEVSAYAFAFETRMNELEEGDKIVKLMEAA
jgi:hypothetical protein